VALFFVCSDAHFIFDDPIIDLDNVEESVLVKNVVKQAKKYQEKLGELGKKEDKYLCHNHHNQSQLNARLLKQG
jgi:hypothetical protein